ncbi:2-hydroxyacyl-CoA dehydratase [Proteiniborus sp.]|uniref:2-hydroxyacyl-CoA dehydratase n=1 Tax=Proteiniborus sp. TaxID=2079015 RepID=UPI00331D5322
MYKVSFPQLGNYNVPLEILFTVGLEVEYVAPPPITKRTLELGSRYSPDFACAPFKYTLGNFIETIEAGANTLVQTGGVCRLGYYGELDEQILKDLGYNIRFVNMAKAKYSNPVTFYNEFKEINPNVSLKKVAKVLPVVIKMVEYIDEIEDYIRKNIGFETKIGSFNDVHENFLAELKSVRTKEELNNTYHKFLKLFKTIEVNKPKNPLRVGIVGEYYTIMEPFSNHYIEKELAQMGIVVDRWMNITNSILHRPEKKAKERIKNYAKYDMGATSMYTIDKALEYAKKGYDGIIHVKSAGCTPEIDAMSVLQNISLDYKIPILYFSFDSQTSDTGIQTRLEAFYDMIIMRKEK